MQYNTESRIAILAFLKKNKERAFSANEIAGAPELSLIGKSTVFRRLASLSREGDIRRISDGESRRVTYQYIDKEHCLGHLHLKCSSCGRLFHLDGELSEGFCRAILTSKHFRIDTSALLGGVCELCTGSGEASV